MHRALHLATPADGAQPWRRALAFAAVAWLPLLVLAAVQGSAWGPDPRSSFLADVSAHVRYLLAIPVLILAESSCLPRLAAIARHFGSSGLVPPGERERLQDILDSVRRSLDHRGLELAVAVTAYVLAIALAGPEYGYGSRGWFSSGPIAGGSGLTPAGWWCALISQPLFLIVWFVWLWRAVVWVRFLWAVSRLDLRLVAAHPDLSAGLRFTADSLGAFSPLGFALGAVSSGSLAAHLIAGGAAPKENIEELMVGVTVALPVFMFALPLLAFARPLRRVRRRATRQYGALAQGLGLRFEDHWLRGGPPVTDAALSAPDFSATTDLYAIVDNVRRMTVIPIGFRDLLPLVVNTLLPFVPVVLLLVPLDRILEGLAGLFF